MAVPSRASGQRPLLGVPDNFLPEHFLPEHWVTSRPLEDVAGPSKETEEHANRVSWVGLGGFHRRRCFRFRGAAEQKAGFDLIEIPLLDPNDFDVEAGAEALRKYGQVATASLGQSRETDMTSEDLEQVAAGEAKLLRCVEVLAGLGGKWLTGALYSELRKYDEPYTDKARANGQSALANVADAAAERGISLGVEVVNRYESNMLNTARQALRYVEEVDRPNVYVHLDSYHMNIEEADMFTPILECGDRLGYVHVGENHRGYLGSGTVNFTEFFHALSAVGYDGPVVFESLSTAVVHPDLSRMLAVWRNLWADSEELARQANDYIRAQILGAQST